MMRYCKSQITQTGYGLRRGLFSMSAWLAIMFIFSIYAMDQGGQDVAFIVGPSSDTDIMGVYIDTWLKWFGLSIFIMTSQAIERDVHLTYGPWLTNDVFDHKTEKSTVTIREGVGYITLYEIFTIAAELFTLNTFLTKQLQYFVIASIPGAAVAIARVYIVLKERNRVKYDAAQIIPSDVS